MKTDTANPWAVSPPVKTASDLKWHMEQSGNEPHFFTRATMRFFGDRMSNYGVRRCYVRTYSDPEPVPCFELYRRRPVKHGLDTSAFFRVSDFSRTFPHGETPEPVTYP